MYKIAKGHISDGTNIKEVIINGYQDGIIVWYLGLRAICHMNNDQIKNGKLCGFGFDDK